MKVKIVKNKVAPPFRTAEFDIFYNQGISPEAEILTIGEKYDVIKKSGASYAFGNTKLGHGFDSARKYLQENKKIMDEIKKTLKEKMKEEAAAAEKT